MPKQVYLLTKSLKIECIENNQDLINLLSYNAIGIYQDIREAQKIRDYLDVSIKINL